MQIVKPDITETQIQDFIMQKNFPCIAAVQSAVRKEYQIGHYGQMGQGADWRKLRQDLLNFLKQQRESQSKYLTYWAVFEPNDRFQNDEDLFEICFWRELSLISSEEEAPQDWGDDNTKDPVDPSFCISLAKEKLFVVGLHPGSSRKGRRFPRPAMIFNAFSQFEKFEAEGTYHAMVNTNRQREMKFQGTVNPMVQKYGDQWEAIQFSGKQNPESWKCPFHLSKQKDKPV